MHKLIIKLSSCLNPYRCLTLSQAISSFSSVLSVLIGSWSSRFQREFSQIHLEMQRIKKSLARSHQRSIYSHRLLFIMNNQMPLGTSGYVGKYLSHTGASQQEVHKSFLSIACTPAISHRLFPSNHS